MGFLEMIVAVVALKTVADIVKTVTRRRERQLDARLVAEVEALRVEVRELRRHHQDTILSFDSTLERLDRRMDRLNAGSERPSELSVGSERVPDREPVTGGRLYR